MFQGLGHPPQYLNWEKANKKIIDLNFLDDLNIDGTFPVCHLMQHKNADPTLPSFFLGGTWVMQSEDLLSKAKLKFISYLVKVGIEPNYWDGHVAKTIANNICCDCHWWWRIWRRLSYQSLARKESELMSFGVSGCQKLMSRQNLCISRP